MQHAERQECGDWIGGWACIASVFHVCTLKMTLTLAKCFSAKLDIPSPWLTITDIVEIVKCFELNAIWSLAHKVSIFSTSLSFSQNQNKIMIMVSVFFTESN